MKNTKFTTLDEMANEFTNESIKNMFIICYKNFTQKALELGKSITDSNRMAFDILIKEKGFEKIINELAKTL